MAIYDDAPRHDDLQPLELKGRIMTMFDKPTNRRELFKASAGLAGFVAVPGAALAGRQLDVASG